jgi:hypothetical protein
MEVGLPAGLEADLRLAHSPGQHELLVHNGKQTELGANTKLPASIAVDDGTISVNVTGGSHHLELVRNP